MRRASTLWLSSLAAALALAGAAEARSVRVFAMQPKLHLSWLESRETYRAKLFALMDARERRPGAPEIQAGADDAASHLLGGGRDLVLWPESIGLFAALTGDRAAAARASGSLEGAIASLVAAYAPQELYYAARFPELGGRTVPTRLLATALTDTFGRSVIESFAEMADRYDVYLHAGVDMVQDWRVVCSEKDGFAPPPGAAGCDVEDPLRVAQLGEPGRDYAYEAVRPDPAVMALVFDPDGRLVSKQVKTYLTPTELGQAEGVTGLDLVPGAVSGLDAVETPVGTLGFVTSKDAWMPDVVQKLDQRHVDLLVQPEFFVGNYVQSTGMWNPDVLLASGYSDVLRHPSFEALALPELTGGVFDFYADHQSHIAVKPRSGREGAGFLVGQPRAPGLVGVTPWVVPDPLTPDEPFPERRRRLGEAGERLQPGSGAGCDGPPPGPCEDGHVEGVLVRDVEVARAPERRRFRGRRARTRFSPARPLSPSPHPQRNVAVARRGRAVLAAFEERRGGRDQVFVVRSRDGGRTWSQPVRPTGRPSGASDEWWPAVALGVGRRATIAWVDRSSGRERAYYARSDDGGRSFSGPRPLDASAPDGAAQWRPALAQGGGDVVHAAWIDERARHADGGAQAGLVYARIAGGEAEPGRRLDGGAPAPLAAKLDNAWAPSVAARGDDVLVTWIDFVHYDWDVFARASADGGERFGPERELNDTPDADEALNDSPQALLAPGGPFVAWTDWRKRDSSAAEPHQMYDTLLARPGGANTQVDPHGGLQASTFSPTACADGGDVLVAFQDASAGQNDVRVVRMSGGERRGRPQRVDDAGRRGGNAWRPRLACSRRHVLAAWEDERDGPPQVYGAVTRAGRIP